MIVRGKQEFLKKINGLASVIEPQVGATMAEWAERISAQQRALVPKRSGALEESIGWTFGDGPKDAKLVSYHGHTPKISGHYASVILFSGSFKAFYARFIEFGTKARDAGRYRDGNGKSRNAGKHGHAATPAHPYFWPVWRANKKDAVKAIRSASLKALKGYLKNG